MSCFWYVYFDIFYEAYKVMCINIALFLTNHSQISHLHDQKFRHNVPNTRNPYISLTKNSHIFQSIHCAKASVFGVFLVRIFSHSDWIRRDPEYLCIQSECMKIQARKSLNTDTFHVVATKYVFATWRFDESLL